MRDFEILDGKKLLQLTEVMPTNGSIQISKNDENDVIIIPHLNKKPHPSVQFICPSKENVKRSDSLYCSIITKNKDETIFSSSSDQIKESNCDPCNPFDSCFWTDWTTQC